MTDMTDELERLLKAATPGPWQAMAGDPLAVDAHEAVYVCKMTGATPVTRLAANAALIVAAVNALPVLIAAARELDAARAELAEINVWTDDNQRGLTAAVANAMWYWDDMPMDCDDAISLTSILKNSLRDNGFQIVRLTAALKGT